eukprot:TRINITY_DN68136_c1_g1_i26.p2 TRINITY_DN68136_c1_g1~~TRINITY_DN68136_c1_g1_i26.p2  ORF type:complete len:110 (-),score=7.25 TRINITY_DN68136_c1_g1_i26:295-624(-)
MNVIPDTDSEEESEPDSSASSSQHGPRIIEDDSSQSTELMPPGRPKTCTFVQISRSGSCPHSSTTSSSYLLWWCSEQVVTDNGSVFVAAAITKLFGVLSLYHQSTFDVS